jgi:hypothetical protein
MIGAGDSNREATRPLAGKRGLDSGRTPALRRGFHRLLGQDLGQSSVKGRAG